jgi:hypothetical protein
MLTSSIHRVERSIQTASHNVFGHRYLSVADIDNGRASEQIVDAASVIAKDKEDIDQRVDRARTWNTGDDRIDQNSQDSGFYKISRLPRLEIDDLGFHDVFAESLTTSCQQVNL